MDEVSCRSVVPLGAEMWAERYHEVVDVPPHIHDFFELAVVCGGNGTHISAGGHQPISSGTALLVSPGQWHGYEGGSGLQINNLYITADVLRRHLRWFARDPVARAILWPPTTPSLPWTTHLSAPALMEADWWCDSLLKRQDHVGRATRLGLLLCVMAVVMPSFDKDDVMPESASPPEPVRAVTKLLEVDLAKQWSIAELAKTVHLSPSHLTQLFTRHTGVPPIAHLTQLRGERAASLLVETTMNIDEVGRSVGWPDPSYLSRRFRSIYGMTPSSYRQCFGWGS